MQAKVSVKLGFVIGVIIFLTASISSLFIGHQFTDIVSAEIRMELYRNLLFNKQMLEQKPNEWQTRENADAWASTAGRALDIRVTIIDLDGRVIGDSYIPSKRLTLVENHRGRPEVRAALEKGYGEDTRYSQTIKEHMLYLAVPVGSPRPYAILRFAKSLYDIKLFDAGLRNGIVLSLCLALFVSLIAGIVLAVFLTRPLRALAAAAHKNGQGNFTALIPHHSNDEIGVLAHTINRMQDEIKKLQLSEEWYHAIFSGIREAIIVTDSDGNIILVNPAASRMFRIDGGMFTSRPLKHLTDAKLQELFAKVHSNRITLLKEDMSLMSSKGVRMMQISSMPVMKDGKFDGTVFVLNDITKLRNLEKVRRDFVSSVSHELRTPLTIITGYTETLLDGAMHDSVNATTFLQIILQASEQLTALVNDVLDLSRIESGHIEYQFMAVDIKSIIEKSVTLLKLSLDKKQIKLDIRIPENLPPVFADAVYLEIVIRNLLDNAIKYVDERNGKIRIAAFRNSNTVQLEVEDNGIGIAKEDLNRIFERFYRVDKARSRQLGGTGLGLSIVKHIVLAHKGNIEVRSRVNHGSVFSILLPVAPLVSDSSFTEGTRRKKLP